MTRSRPPAQGDDLSTSADDPSGTPAPQFDALRASTVSGLKWAATAQVVRQAAQFVAGVVITRIAGPDAISVVILAQSLVNLAYLFRNLGTTTALVQARTITPRLVSSLFWVNTALGVGLAALVIAVAGPVARYNDEPRLAPVLGAIALGLVVTGTSSVHLALLERELQFRKVALVEGLATLVSCAAGIVAAMQGLSYWSAVVQLLTHAVVATIGFWAASGMRPRFEIGGADLRSMLSFSANLTGFELLNWAARNLDNIIVRKALGPAALGLYGKAYEFLLAPLLPVWAVVARVAFPALCRLRDDHPRFRAAWLSVIGAIGVVSFPMALGCLAVSRELVLALLGEDFRGMVPLVRVFAPLAMIQSVVTMTGTIFQAQGRTDLMLRLACFTVPVLVLGFLVGVHWGLDGVAIGYFVAVVLISVPTLAVSFSLVGLRFIDLWRAIRRPMLCAALMCAVVAATGAVLPEAWPVGARLALLVAEGVLTQAALSWTLDREQVRELYLLFIRRTVVVS